MKINLEPEQIEFLNKEFGLTEDDILAMTEEKWDEINEKCYNLFLDLSLDDNDELIEESVNDNRCMIASSLSDLFFDELFTEY